jgi:hypothetical protein
MRAQTISAWMGRGSPTGFEVRIRFIVMFFLLGGLVVLGKRSPFQDVRQIT